MRRTIRVTLELGMVFICIGIFYMPFVLRRKLLPGSLEYLNMIAILGLIILFASNYIYSRKIIKCAIAEIITFSLITIVTILFLSSTLLSNSLGFPIRYYITVILPALFIFVEIKR